MSTAARASGYDRTVDLSALFRPLRIRSLELKNRFVMPSMQRGWCIDGHPPGRLAEYYAARACGGVQLILSECIAVDHPAASRTRKYGRLAAGYGGGLGKMRAGRP
jgi:2,4-dienoyl-CoA reductase-like NADH-dependent reductase (Old Yellow Enzyme family)